MHFKAIIFLSLLFMGFMAPQPNRAITDLLVDAKALVYQYKDKEAKALYEQVLEADPDNFEAICGVSFTYAQIGNKIQDKTSQTEHFNKAQFYAMRAYQIDPNHAESNFLMAMAIGRKMTFAGPEEMLKSSFLIKQYADKAVALEPTHDRAWYILGKWHQRLSNLSFLETALAELLFGGLPEGASFEQSIVAFNKALENRPNYILYLWDLAETYKYMGDEPQAIHYAQLALQQPLESPDDPWFQSQCRLIISDLE